MRTLLTWCATAALLAASWFLLVQTPDEEDAEAPFVVAASLGEPAAGRNIEVTVESVTRAKAVAGTSSVSERYLWSAEGNWLVVDLAVATRESSLLGTLRVAELEVGDRRFRASERVSSLFGSPLANGLPRRGSLAFEIPEDAAGEATLTLGLASDPRLDSVIEYAFDLDDTPRVAEAEVKAADW